MMHEIAIRCGNGAGSIGQEMSKIDHRKNHCLWFGEDSCVCTKSRADRVVRSRERGTCTPLGTGGCAYRVCSHMCGTYKQLLGRAGRAANISEQVRIAVVEAAHVNPALMAETDEQGIDDTKDCPRKSSQ